MLFERIKLEEDEKLIEIVRKHWWIIATQTAAVVFFMLLPYFVTASFLNLDIFNQYFGASNFSDLITGNRAEIIFVYLLWLLGLWVMLANFWTDHYLDLWAITNRRVVLVDQRGFFRRYISSFRLERLQDMNIEVNGVLATLLDYGTIEAQTAGGSHEDFTSQFMPKPRDIKATIVSAADDLTSTQAAKIQTLKEQGL